MRIIYRFMMTYNLFLGKMCRKIFQLVFTMGVHSLSNNPSNKNKKNKK